MAEIEYNDYIDDGDILLNDNILDDIEYVCDKVLSKSQKELLNKIFLKVKKKLKKLSNTDKTFNVRNIYINDTLLVDDDNVVLNYERENSLSDFTLAEIKEELEYRYNQSFQLNMLKNKLIRIRDGLCKDSINKQDLEEILERL